jgi:ATP-binding protein involved in chromosome partitioning
MTQSQVDRAAVDAVLADFQDPETGRSVVETGQVRDVKIEGDQLSLTLELTTHSAPLWAETIESLADKLRGGVTGLKDAKIERAEHARPPMELGQVGLKAKSVIAVGSGKGGVGKSTVAASIAFGLAQAGCQVGLMDADVYGPSIPHLLGVGGKPEFADNKLQPIDADGVKVMSMGFLIPADQAVVWRGPMLHSAITQFLRDTAWGELDYLIIDMPPGTGDIALTLSQLLPITGAVVVCTPQDVALLDAVKAISMFRTVKIPPLGMVENMSFFECPGCNKRYDIFGSGGAKRMAEEMGLPLLGEVPINIQIRVNGDEGNTAANLHDEVTGSHFQTICKNLAKSVAESSREKPSLPSLSVVS